MQQKPKGITFLPISQLSTKGAPAKPRFRRRSEVGGEARGMFPHKVLPLILLLPQFAVVAVFFLWPAIRALVESLYQVNAFGLGGRYAGLANFRAVITSGTYGQSVAITLLYAAVTTLLAMGMGLFLATMVDRARRGRSLYRTLFAWTYAVPAAISGSLWLFMFNPQIGVGARLLADLGISWNFTVNFFDAMALIIIVTVWQQAAYNFLFFTAGLQAIPAEVLEAGALDGAGALTRFWRIIFPLLSPTTFYLLIMNVIYVFFSTFSIIDIVTQGGPHNGTTTMVYQIYRDAFQNSNTSMAAAETVLLIILVGLLTMLQFRSVNRQVHYQ